MQLEQVRPQHTTALKYIQVAVPEQQARVACSSPGCRADTLQVEVKTIKDRPGVSAAAHQNDDVAQVDYGEGQRETDQLKNHPG